MINSTPKLLFLWFAICAMFTYIWQNPPEPKQIIKISELQVMSVENLSALEPGGGEMQRIADKKLNDFKKVVISNIPSELPRKD